MGKRAKRAKRAKKAKRARTENEQPVDTVVWEP